MRKIYGRGLNIACQLDNSYKSIKEFKQLYQFPVVQLGCGYLQSYLLLQNGALIKRGAYMDTLSNLRTIAHYRFSPALYKIIQTLGQFSRKIGLPLKSKDFVQIGGSQISEKVQYKKAIFMHAAIHLFDQNNCMHVVGENYFGQRATGNQITIEDKLRIVEQIKVVPNTKQISLLKSKVKCKVKDAALGFHHTILISQNGEAYGCGRADYNQIQPYRFNFSREIKTLSFIIDPELVFSKEKVIKAACGNKHTILYTEARKLYGIGDNSFGQCGQNIKHYKIVSRIQEIIFPFLQGQVILDIKCGSYHTLILTNMHLYFMGSIKMNQNPFTKFKQNISSPTIMDLPSKPIKIFTQFERTAVICADGKAYFFGGQDLSKYGGETGNLQVIDSFKLDQNSLIGLGFSHTLIAP